MAFKLSKRSLDILDGVHPDLARVIKRALEISLVEFVVTEGRRSLERQRALVKAGASKTLDSRHLGGWAVDLAPRVDGVIRWDWPLFYKIAAAVKAAAAELAVPIEWGGDWTTFKDGPHFQLPRGPYPAPAKQEE